jgi:dihydroflavonol-4-reductase
MSNTTHSILLTGATGFLGSELLQQLLADGESVVVLSRRPLPDLTEQGVKVVVGDILDADSVKAAAEGCDRLYHCAGLVSRDPEDNLRMTEVNIEGTKIVLDAAREAGVRRAVVASTSGTVAISEKKSPLVNENSPVPYRLVGKWGYYRSKLYAEMEALKRNTEGFEVLCVNPSLLLGPGDERGHSVEDIRLFLEQRIAGVPPGGLSFVDVRDVAVAMRSAMLKGRPGHRYLLGSSNLTFEEFFGRLERISGIKAPWMPLPNNINLVSFGNKLLNRVQEFLGESDGPDEVSLEMSQYFWYLDNTKAVEELGFEPRDSMQTLKDTVMDLMDRGVVWPQDHESTGLEALQKLNTRAIRGVFQKIQDTTSGSSS